MDKIAFRKDVKKSGHYSPGIISQGMLYVSGQMPLHPDTAKLTVGIRAQSRHALQNLERVLEAAGVGRSAAVQCRVYLSDIGNWDVFNEVYAEFLGEHRPARTVVPVSALHYGSLIEIEAIAEVEE